MKLNTKSLAGVEYGFVVLSTGTYTARIKSITVKPNKEQTGNNIVVVHQILDRMVNDHKGNVVENRGNIMATRWIGMQATETYDPDRLVKELSVACGVPEDYDGEVTDAMLVGKIVMVKIRFREAKDGFPETHDVAGWLPPTDEAKALAASAPF